jgi:uncharacterized protein YxjI
MDDSDLKDYAEESLKEGYTKEELGNILLEEGYDEERVRDILEEIDDEKFAVDLGGNVQGLNLDDEEYEIVQALVRNRYRTFDSDGELVLEAYQKLFRAKESFSFRDSEGEEVFDIDADQVMDFSGDYVLKDSETDEAFAVLEKKFTLFQQRWKVKNPDSEELAEITSRSSVLDFLRSFSDFFSLIPHKYSIESPEGESLGVIQGKLGLKDRYILNIDDTGDSSREVLVAAAVAADALE